MDAYLQSLIPYTIVANIVALPLILLGRKFGLRCHPVEYVMIYFSWLVFVLLVGSVFDDLNHAMAELQVSSSELNTVFGIVGFFAGLSLLPKVFFAKKKTNTVLITSLTAIFVAVICAKFVVLAFLFTVEGV